MKPADPDKPTTQETSSRRTRIAALAEVTGVLAGGNILAILLNRSLGFARYRELIRDIPDGIVPDFYNLALISGAELLIKYAILFGMAYAIGRWHRKRPLKAYGLTRGGYSLSNLIVLGLVAGLIANIFPDLLYYLDTLLNGSSDLVTLDDTYRATVGFWVLQAVAGFVLVPILEELFMRGYYQTRLAEDFSPGTAVWIMAFMFAFSHTRFIQADVFNLLTLASIIFSAAIYGYLIHRTGSLIPSVIAHAVLNVPFRGIEVPIVLALSVLVILLLWKSVRGHAREFLSLLSVRPVGWAIVGILMVLAISLPLLVVPETLLFWGVGGLLVALVLEYQEKKEQVSS